MAKPTTCQKCGARCCRYVAIEIDTPHTEGDFDDFRWYVAHKKVTVFKHDGEWHLNIDNRCKFLGKGNRCTMYKKRPRICRKYDIDECEVDGLDYDVEFRNVADVDAYIKKRRKRLAKRKKKRKKRKARK